MRLGERQPSRGPGFDPDLPVSGFYRVKLRKGAVDSALAIWHGPTADPDGGDIMERPWAWQARLNGTPCDVFAYWPACARDPISREEHDRITDRNRTMEEKSPFYDPKKRLDINSAPPPF
jgi:hypothetical protein